MGQSQGLPYRYLDWPGESFAPPPHEGDIHLWKFFVNQPDEVRARLASHLQPDEISRVSSLRFEADQERATVARGVLREIVSQYLNILPSALRLENGFAGKPALASIHHSTLGFNLSHSGQLGILAVVSGGSVGIDVEEMRQDVKPSELADSAFSPAEIRQIRSVEQVHQNEWFFQGWVRKEAFLKALGCGLSAPLDSFTLILDPAVRFQHTPPMTLTQGRRFVIECIDPHPGYAGAIAVEALF